MGAQMRRSRGFKPIRCSSMVQTSTLAYGKAVADLSEKRTEVFMKAVCSSGSASACCGRGSCWLCVRRCR